MTNSVELQFDTEIRAASDPNSISQAKNLLGKGQLVAIPTETVYGLAANAFSEEAVARINFWEFWNLDFHRINFESHFVM